MESSNGYGFDLSSGPNFELDWFFITHPYSAVGRCTLLSIVIEKRIMLFHDGVDSAPPSTTRSDEQVTLSGSSRFRKPN